MLPIFRDHFGNPSSVHSFGQAARARVDEAREEVADLIQAHPGEIVFTSGGTESDNLAILGTALAQREKGRHIITCQMEHPAVLNACKQLELLDFTVDYLPVNRQGRLDVELLKQKISSETILITIQHANSEVGTLQDIEAIGELAQERGVVFHTDAVQSVGKVRVDTAKLPVDMLSISAHKLYGPKGVGALFIKKGAPQLFPLINGGGQERKRRGGTENVAGIVGFGKACQLAKARMASGPRRLEAMRDRLHRLLQENIPVAELFGDPRHRLPNTLNLGFEGADGENLTISLDLEGIAVSTGSACSSGSISPSHVLSAMRVPQEKIRASIRFSLGWGNTPEEMDKTSNTLRTILQRMRKRPIAPAPAP